MMVSAFDPAVPIDRMKQRTEQTIGPDTRVNSLETGELLNVHGGKEHRPMLDSDAEEEETEDEEVKINCIGGITAVADSDTSDSDDNDDDSQDQDMDSDVESDGERADDGVVNFASVSAAELSPPAGIRKPTPILRRVEQGQKAFAPAPEEDDASDSSSDSEASTSSSVSSGARGIGLSLETTTPGSGEDMATTDDESVSDDDNGQEEDSDSDDDSAVSSENESQDESELHVSDTSDVDGSESNESSDDDDDDESVSSQESNTSETDTSRDVIKVPLHDANDSWETNAAIGTAANPSMLRRPSFNVDEIGEMLDADPQDLDGNDGLLLTADAKVNSNEELNELLSDALEFDYWSSETLSAVVDALASARKGSELNMSVPADYPIRLPRRDDADFWIDKMGHVIFPESRLREYLEANLEQKMIASRIVFDVFHSEVMSLDLTRIVLEKDEANEEAEKREHPQLFVGSFSAAESRLALAVLNIKRVIQISHHPLDELWVADGVMYSTHVLPSLGNGGSSPVHGAIEEAAEEVGSALREGGPGSVLVTCSTGDEHSCAVCAVYLARLHGISGTAAAAKVAQQRSSCRIDPEWLPSDVTSVSHHLHRTKRVLSSNKLSSLGPTQGLGFGSPKRMRCTKDSRAQVTIPLLPALSLGPAAQDVNEAIGPRLQMRGSDEYVSSSTEEEEEREQDMRLSEELEENGEAQSKPSTPIPLLTPPASPVQVESEQGTTTVCEWPSNLTVDSAMTAAIDLRPLSPKSLQQQEEEAKRVVSDACGRAEGSNRKSIPQQSTLTPLIKGICVKFD